MIYIHDCGTSLLLRTTNTSILSMESAIAVKQCTPFPKGTIGVTTGYNKYAANEMCVAQI